jgi:hypothetical protein
VRDVDELVSAVSDTTELPAELSSRGATSDETVSRTVSAVSDTTELPAELPPADVDESTFKLFAASRYNATGIEFSEEKLAES